MTRKQAVTPGERPPTASVKDVVANSSVYGPPVCVARSSRNIVPAGLLLAFQFNVAVSDVNVVVDNPVAGLVSVTAKPKPVLLLHPAPLQACENP